MRACVSVPSAVLKGDVRNRCERPDCHCRLNIGGKKLVSDTNWWRQLAGRDDVLTDQMLLNDGFTIIGVRPLLSHNLAHPVRPA